MQPRNPMSRVRTYGALGLLRLGRDWMATRLLLPNARLVRWPFYLRGKPWIRIGDRLTTGPGVRLDAFPPPACKEAVLQIGSDVQLNDSVHIAAIQSVRIGNRVLIASRVFISDHNHGIYAGAEVHSDPATAPHQRPLSSAPVTIEDDVWIGESAAVLPGVTIGKGSVIGALALACPGAPPRPVPYAGRGVSRVPGRQAVVAEQTQVRVSAMPVDQRADQALFMDGDARHHAASYRGGAGCLLPQSRAVLPDGPA